MNDISMAYDNRGMIERGSVGDGAGLTCKEFNTPD